MHTHRLACRMAIQHAGSSACAASSMTATSKNSGGSSLSGPSRDTPVMVPNTTCAPVRISSVACSSRCRSSRPASQTRQHDHVANKHHRLRRRTELAQLLAEGGSVLALGGEDLGLERIHVAPHVHHNGCRGRVRQLRIQTAGHESPQQHPPISVRLRCLTLSSRRAGCPSRTTFTLHLPESRIPSHTIPAPPGQALDEIVNGYVGRCACQHALPSRHALHCTV